MKNKVLLRFAALPMLILWLILIVGMGCTNTEKHTEHPDTYTCPMHPTVVSDKPGTCPVCAMDLVRKARPGEEIKVTEELASLIKSPNEVVVSAIKTLKGEFKVLPVSVSAQGVVTYDTRNVYTIAARVGGRLEKVFLKYAFQQVQRGQKVVEIYSPELLTAQRELLYLAEHDPDNTAMIESAKNKLYLLGATQNQVETLLKGKEAPATFSIYSQYDGFVIRDDQEAPAVSTTITASSASASMGGGMGSSAAPTQPTTSNTMNAGSAELLREGNYVSVGQTLFKIVNTAALRVELALPLAYAGLTKVNDEIDLDLGKLQIKGKVDFIQPFFNNGEEFVKLRLYVPNHHALRIGQLVNATIHVSPVEALWVPRDAVLDLGLDKVVFVKERGVFKSKVVQVGPQSTSWVVITQGISSADEIAANAQYMVDSESFIKTK